GAARRPEDAIPWFAEMAVPGTSFEGVWRENSFLELPEVAKALRAKDRISVSKMLPLINTYTRGILQIHRQYAEWTALAALQGSFLSGEARLASVGDTARKCILPLGWGAGFLSKTAMPDTTEPTYRQILRQLPYYSRAIQSNLPFPKTRRIVFLNNQPAALAG